MLDKKANCAIRFASTWRLPCLKIIRKGGFGMSRLVEHAKKDLLEGEEFMKNQSLHRSFDAIILIGPQGRIRLSDFFKFLKIEKRGPRFGGSTIIMVGGGEDIYKEYDCIGYELPIKCWDGVDVISLGGDILLSEGIFRYTVTYILKILSVQERREVVLSGREDELVKVVKSLRGLINEDHDRYGQISLYAVPSPALPQKEVE